MIQRMPETNEQAPAATEQPQESAGPTEEAAPAQMSEATPAAKETATPGWIVDDSVEERGPGQMKKSDFLTELHAEVCSAAEEILASTGRTTEGCPYLDYWFNYYGNQDSLHIERAIQRYSPEASGATTTARDYIPIITARVRRGVEVWARSGELCKRFPKVYQWNCLKRVRRQPRQRRRLTRGVCSSRVGAVDRKPREVRRLSRHSLGEAGRWMGMWNHGWSRHSARVSPTFVCTRTEGLRTSPILSMHGPSRLASTWPLGQENTDRERRLETRLSRMRWHTWCSREEQVLHWRAPQSATRATTRWKKMPMCRQWAQSRLYGVGQRGRLEI